MSELSAVYSSSSPHIACQNREKSAKDLITFSSTDEKIYKIAGGVLIGTAFAIGAVSLYAAFFISATYAWGLGLALACGAIGEKILSAYAPDSQNGKTSPAKESSSSESVEGVRRPRAAFVPGQPVGIRNGSCNCWANSVLQFARHIPSLYNLVQTDADLQPAFGNFYQAYDAAREAQQHVATRASSQTIRQCLHKLKKDGISERAGRQEDAHEGLMAIMRKFDPTYMHVERGSGDRYEPDTVMTIHLDDHRGRSLDALFEHTYMIRVNEAGGAFLRFMERPKELFFHIARFKQTPSGAYRKNSDLLNIGPTFTLPERRVDEGGGGEYECDAFIEHQGPSMAGGHYVAYVLVDGQWWLCNDDDVTAVSDAEVAQARRRAYILHFRAT
jgi:Ubiquitin carboxyl-terminal hydrolase